MGIYEETQKGLTQKQQINTNLKLYSLRSTLFHDSRISHILYFYRRSEKERRKRAPFVSHPLKDGKGGREARGKSEARRDAALHNSEAERESGNGRLQLTTIRHYLFNLGSFYGIDILTTIPTSMYSEDNAW